MSRTRAESLVLVNWKGVFYARYGLDRHVTALEGANGAGKTTVMIAAYLVLLPDMGRLRFTNVGESGVTGGDRGVWGRLGHPGRPSFAAIDFRLSNGKRLIAGVQLERKGEPSVEPTPFIVMGLDEGVALQELMLVTSGGEHGVPELPELRENALRLGGRMQVFATARDYFGKLFDNGVLPLRLGTDEERNKFNEMLRTSMTGGISRGLTTELRDFLLREASGLADTLQSMHGNLDACRRTRYEVQESRRLNEEIGGVHEAGHAMFWSALAGTRERMLEHERQLAEAEAMLEVEAQALEDANDAWSRVLAEIDLVDRERRETGASLVRAREARDLMERAVAAEREVRQKATRLGAAELEARQARTALDHADARRAQSRVEVSKAQDDLARAASGLADLQRGLDDLHRRAHAYQKVTRRLSAVEARLGPIEATREGLQQTAFLAEAELNEVDAERREAAVRSSDAEAHARRHEEVMAALEVLVDKALDGEPIEVARAGLSRWRELGELAGRREELSRDLHEAERLRTKQDRARERAEKVGIETSGLATGEAAISRVREALDAAEGGLARCEEAERKAKLEAASLERELHEARATLTGLELREPVFHDLDHRARRIAAEVGQAIGGRASLDAARERIHRDLAERRAEAASLAERAEGLRREARHLLAGGGALDAALAQLRSVVGGELLAARFEDVSPKEAAVLEARLGPLTQALVVDDPHEAARVLAQWRDSQAARDLAEQGASEGAAAGGSRSARGGGTKASARRPASAGVEGDTEDASDVWLVPSEGDLEGVIGGNVEGRENPREVWVEERLGLRVTRVPERPRLGRRAREARARELEVEAEACLRAGEAVADRRRQLERLVEDGDALLAGWSVWSSGDPAAEMMALRGRIEVIREGLEAARYEAARAADAARESRPRVSEGRDLLSDAWLLAPPDHGERAAGFRAMLARAREAADEVNRKRGAALRVESELGVLSAPPLSIADRERLVERVAELRARRDVLDEAVDGLRHVRDNFQALSWGEAPRRLREEQQIVPALEAQLRESEAALQARQREAEAAEAAWDHAQRVSHMAEAERATAASEHAAAEGRLRETGVVSPSVAALERSIVEVATLEAASERLERRLRQLTTEQGRWESNIETVRQRHQGALELVGKAKREAEVERALWERVSARARAEGLIVGGREWGEARGSIYHFQDALRHRATLDERLGLAQAGGEVVARMRDEREAMVVAETAIDNWVVVREWLRQRLPAQIADVADPSEGLARLRDQLVSLTARLTRQEGELRGKSEDVARGIDTHIRAARNQVKRLNESLRAVSFGGVASIRVRLEPIGDMERVLEALRGGHAQSLLFDANMPIEEALDEILRQYSGKRASGQRLLDFRAYVNLQVEIRRKSGADWELAIPTKLSTGEAIGVGAALMMVVLTEWERDATVSRPKKSSESLRFLFLDEANRLSQDNLGVLFDLCKTLDLQLLIAAPEVARAEGNTTYRLVRKVDGERGEVVLVSGRHARGAG